MKFKENISRALACSLLLSMYNCCIANGAYQDNKKEENLETALVVYNPNPSLFPENNIQLAHSNNQLTQNVSSRSCYICETKDNPRINHVLGENRESLDKPVTESCFICNTFMHADCWDKFSKEAAEKYKDQMSEALIDSLKNGKTKLCPYCLYHRLKEENNSKKKDENEKKESMMEKKVEEKTKDREGITFTKKELYISGAAILVAVVVNRQGPNVTINNNK